MKNPIHLKTKKPYDYSNWFLRHSFNFLGFPFAILAIFFSLYSDVVDHWLVEDEQVNHSLVKGQQVKGEREENTFLHKIVNFVANDSSISNNNSLPFTPTLEKDSLTYNHLFIVDRTGSTKNIGGDYSEFNKQTQAFIGSLFGSAQVSLVKQGIFLSYLKFFFQSDESFNFQLLFYDGGNVFKELTYTDGTALGWVRTTKQEMRHFIIDKANEDSLFTFNQGIVQKTRLVELLQKLKNMTKKNLIITLLGDVVDDNKRSLSDDDIRKVNEKGNIKGLNLLYLQSSNKSEREVSDKLVDKIQQLVDNEIVRTYKINTEDLQDKHYSTSTFETYSDKLEDCFTTNIIQDQELDCYFPAFNSKKNAIATRIIKFDTTTKSEVVKWRVACKDDIVFQYRTSKSTLNASPMDGWNKKMIV